MLSGLNVDVVALRDMFSASIKDEDLFAALKLNTACNALVFRWFASKQVLFEGGYLR